MSPNVSVLLSATEKKKGREVHVGWRVIEGLAFLGWFCSLFLFTEYNTHIIRSINHNHTSREFLEISTPLKPAPTYTRTLPAPSPLRALSTFKKPESSSWALWPRRATPRGSQKRPRTGKTFDSPTNLKRLITTAPVPHRRKRKWPPVGPPFRPPRPLAVSQEPSRPLKVSGPSCRSWRRRPT